MTKQYNLDKYDIINLDLNWKSTTKTTNGDIDHMFRPCIIEFIGRSMHTNQNILIYRPITDLYARPNVQKPKIIEIANWKQAGLSKPSGINAGVRQIITLDKLPNKIDKIGTIPHTIDDKPSLKDKLDRFLTRSLIEPTRSIREQLNRNHSYLKDHNHAYTLMDQKYGLNWSFEDTISNTIHVDPTTNKMAIPKHPKGTLVPLTVASPRPNPTISTSPNIEPEL